MDVYHSGKDKFNARKRKFLDAFETLEEHWTRIKKEHQTLQDKKDALSKQNDGSEVSDKDVLNINAGGTIVRVTRGTLTQFKGTRLEAIFSGRWEKQLNRDNMGRIFLDVNPVCFKTVVDFLNECKISPPENRPNPPTVDTENQPYLENLLVAFGLHDFAYGQLDSTILTESGHVRALTEFLTKDDIPSTLNLLYRGSRDGMNAAAFHRKCDNMGATVIVVKTTEGYIFGAYADKSWTSTCGKHINSSESFLFGLRCHGNQYPTKMRIKGNQHSNAFYHNTLCGPIFGQSYDLVFFNQRNQCWQNLGNTYALPPGKNKYFFTGNQVFAPAEVEIFQIPPNCEEHDPCIQSDTIIDFSAIPKDIEEIFKEEEQQLFDATDELSELQISFDQEKNAVKLFCASENNVVVNLNVSGHCMAVSTSTLSQYPDSVLYKQFADPKWQSSLGKVKCGAPRDWDNKQVVEWVRSIKRLSSDVSDHFKSVTGGELLAMDRREDIKDLGIQNPGTVALLVKTIQKLRDEDDQMSAPLVEHSEYCFGKIIDHMRVKAMSSAKLVPAPLPPKIREGDKERFKRIVDFYFPNESASDFLA